MAAIDQIIVWAKGLSPWLGDLVRRHLISSAEFELSESDYKDVLKIARNEFKLDDQPHPIAPIYPESSMLSGSASSTKAVILKSISDCKRVNVIKETEVLPFSEKGVTVIYGNNGVGKSGYARVLKLACSARDKKDVVIPNIYAPTSVEVPTAKINLIVNGAPESVDWVQGGPSSDLLSNIAVFDSRCARVIIDEKYEISYLPYGADVFEKVVASASRIKADIESALENEIAIQDSAIHPETTAAAFLASLSATTTAEQIEIACSWTAEHEAGLLEAIELQRVSQEGAVTAEISRLSKSKERIEATSNSINGFLQTTAAVTKDAVQSSLVTLDASIKANAIAIAERQVQEPLSGVAATSEWEILYTAAKKYSEEVAYPEREYPYIGDGSACVLCQQPLGDGAKERFQRFKRFVEDKTADDVRAARAAISQLRKTVQDSSLQSDEVASLSVEGVKEFDKAVVT